MICFFERNKRTSTSRHFPSTCSHRSRAKLTDSPIARESAAQFSGRTGSTKRGGPLALGRSPRAGLSFWAAFPRARRVSAGVMRYLAERDRELLSRGESTAAARPQTDTHPPNAILPSSPLLYLSAVRIKRENDWGRDGVNMAEPPSDRRHAHSADKVEPRPTEEGLSGHTRKHTHTSIQVHCTQLGRLKTVH